MAYIPFFLKVHERDRIVIIGGGRTALAKAEVFAACQVVPEIIAPEVCSGLVLLLKELGGKIRYNTYKDQYLDSASLVVAATDNVELNRQIYRDAKTRKIAVNLVDTPELCDFIFPAIIRRGELQIAISSSGNNPVLARWIKRKIEQVLPWNLEKLVAWLRTKKEKVRQKIKRLQARRLFWEEILEGPVSQEVLEGNKRRAESLFETALASCPKQAGAALYLVGAGPGHPDLLTVRAAQILGKADVILYDRLVSPDLLKRYARKEAEKILVGKRGGHSGVSQHEISGILEKHLQCQQIVVRLKGGDPGVYAHSAEELEIAHQLRVPCQVIPGITAALGCAAMAGIPLTERGGAKSLRFLTVYNEDLYPESFWKSLLEAQPETLVFYMSFRHHISLCQKLLQVGFDSSLPILAVEQGTTPQHREFVTTLGAFAGESRGAVSTFPAFTSPVLLIVGDVVRWQEKHAWKEAPESHTQFFSQQEKKEYAHVR